MKIHLVLLDRDGVLNEDRPDSVKNPDELRLISGAGAAIARLDRAGIKVALCTNQSVVGRGIIGPEMLARIHATLAAGLAAQGGKLDAIFVCTDAPGTPSSRRKPAPGLLREALQRFDVEPEAAPMIGDALRDLEAAAAAGCPRHLVRTGKGARTQADGLPQAVLPVAVHEDLAAAVEALLGTPR